MNRTDTIYAFLLSRGIVTVNDLTRFAIEELGSDYSYLYKQYLHKFLADGKLTRIRRGMYAVNNIYDRNAPNHDRYLIAAKIRDHYYLGYHTALELHGCAYSAVSQCQIGVGRNSWFRPFRFEGISYRPVIQDDLELEITELTRAGNKIRFSSASRTFVECVRRMDIVGGLEECLKSVDGLGGVALPSIERMLDYYQSDILIRTTGFFLDHLRQRSPYYEHITVNDLETFNHRIGRAPMYLMKNVPSVLNTRWKLYVPVEFEELARGV